MEKMVLGKSTLAKLISGLVKPQKGKIYVDNILTSDKKEFLNLRKRVGIVFQNPENQIIFNNVYDDIAFAIKNLKLDDEEIRVKTALEKLKMQEYINSPTYELSLGQKQRITIAGIVAINPKYIIFDEPTTMLDSEGKEDVYKIVNELKKQGFTIIYITNVIEEILNSDKIIVVEKGKIIKQFMKKDILENIGFLEQHDIKIPNLVKMLKQIKQNGTNIELDEWTREEITNKIIEVAKNEN